MRTGRAGAGALAAVAALAAGIAFSLAGKAVAGQGDRRVDAATDIRRVETVRAEAVLGPAVTGGIPTKCGKCHNSCEDGITHASLAVTGMRGGGDLPLNAEGQVDCLTCHAPHRDGVERTSSSRLRISNLRRELCLACHRQQTGDSPRIEIVSPLERAVVQEDRLALIGRALRLPEDLLTVRLNGSAFFLQVKDGHFFTWLKLQDGVNTIELLQDERVLWKDEVFHGRGALDSYGRTSSGHGTGSREECLGCHLVKGTMSAETTGATPALCYGCHDRFDEKRYVHGPLAVGDCLACHDPHGGFGSAHLRQEQGPLCRNCHPVRENSPKVACDASGKDCVDCHDPHQSNARYLLKGPQYTLRYDFTELH